MSTLLTYAGWALLLVVAFIGLAYGWARGINRKGQR